MSDGNRLPEEELYGASGLSLIQKLQMLAEWAPLVAQLQAVANAKNPQERALAVVKVLRWAAGKSSTELDDEALDHLEAVLKSPEGAAFYDWIVKKIEGVTA